MNKCTIVITDEAGVTVRLIVNDSLANNLHLMQRALTEEQERFLCYRCDEYFRGGGRYMTEEKSGCEDGYLFCFACSEKTKAELKPSPSIGSKTIIVGLKNFADYLDKLELIVGEFIDDLEGKNET